MNCPLNFSDSFLRAVSNSTSGSSQRNLELGKTFNKGKVPGANILGEPDKGWQIVRTIIEKAAIAKCCAMVGAMEAVLEMTVEYAKERKQYDQPIGAFQVIQHYCADMAIDVDASRYGTYQAAWMLSEGIPCSKEVAEAKSFINESFERFIALAHQIHGAIGVTIDHDLQYYTKRAKSAQLSYGSSDFHRETVARYDRLRKAGRQNRPIRPPGHTPMISQNRPM